MILNLDEVSWTCNLDLEVGNGICIIFVKTNEIPYVDCIVRLVN